MAVFCLFFYTDTVHFEGGYKYVFSHSCLLNPAMLSDQNDDSFIHFALSALE